MFITKKKFNEAIEAAKMEREKELWLNERLFRIEDDLNRRMTHLEKRIYKLENLNEKDKPGNGLMPASEY